MRFPSHTSKAELHGPLTNAEFPRKCSNGKSHLMGGTAKRHYFPSQFVHRIIVTVKMSVASNPFLVHVLAVLRLGSKPKMFWINAGRIITTGAVMQHAKPFWNRSKMQYPRGYISSDRFASNSASADLSVTVGELRSCPNPTGIGLFDFSPKPLWKGFGKSLLRQVFRGNLDHSSVMPRLGYWPAEASSLSHIQPLTQG